MEFNLEESWKELLKDEFDQAYYKKLMLFLTEEYASRSVFPQSKFVYKALNLCPINSLKVVVIGQDPYHTRGMADGLCFSVPSNTTKIPPSLKNIITEINSDVGGNRMETCDLSYLACQGVLLLNTVLTVREGEANSHAGMGWEQFTDAILKVVAARKKNVVFILWGAKAQKKAAFINKSENLIISSPHPSPLSSYRGFFGSEPFSKTNTYLTKNGIEKIEW